MAISTWVDPGVSVLHATHAMTIPFDGLVQETATVSAGGPTEGQLWPRGNPG